jgi:protein-histidine pros-kinase
VKLLVKFNVIVIVAFGIAAGAIATIAYGFLLANARQQVLQEAQLMMASATSMRDYTSNDLSPLLETTEAHRKRFLPETVPAFAATTIFSALRKTYPDYTYKEATLNPTNLADRATDWEADVIRDLRNHPALQRLVGERDGATSRELYLAVPIVAKAECMQCHSTAAAAPPAMIARYGSANGFGWNVGETIGAQMVSIPLAVPVAIATDAFRRLVFSLALALVVTIVVLDAGVFYFVIRPLARVASVADRVSTGDTSAPELPVRGNDEIAVVTGAFNRMRVSLAKALRLLADE